MILPKRAAKRIAKVLFRVGCENESKRLVLEMLDGDNGGGWCFSAVVDEINRGLQEEVRRVAATKKAKPSYKRPQYEKPPVKKPAKKQPWV